MPISLQLFGDVLFKTRMAMLAREHPKAAAAAGHTNSPLFMYHFNFVGRYSCLKWLTKTKMGKTLPPVKGPYERGFTWVWQAVQFLAVSPGFAGASHGDDLWYLSNISLFPLPKLDATSREEVCRERMVTFWTNFVKTG